MPDTTDKPPRIPLHHHLLGISARGIVWAVRTMPAPLAYGLADVAALGLIAWTVLFVPPRKGTPRSTGFYRNYDIVFRDKANKKHRRRLMLGWARHMCHLSVDFCRIPKITAETIDKYVDATDYAVLRKHVKGGKGVIGVTGHVGCFELGGFIAPLSGVPSSGIYNDSPFEPVTRFLSEIRGCRGLQILKREGATRSMIRSLQQGLNVGFAVDTLTKQGGVFAPFLGTLASTNKTAALLHLKTGAPIIVHTTTRVGRFRFKFKAWDVIEHTKTDDKHADALAIMTRINNALSRAILECPEQWFWHSRRFRYRPPGETMLPNQLPPLVEDSVHA